MATTGTSEFNYNLEMQNLTKLILARKDVDLKRFLINKIDFYNDSDVSNLSVSVLDLIVVDLYFSECGILDVCCNKGYVKIVEQLLKFPEVDPSNHSNYPLKCAIQINSSEIIKLLIKHEKIKIYNSDLTLAITNDRDINILTELLNGNLKYVDFNNFFKSNNIADKYENILNKYKPIQIKLSEYNQFLDNNKKL